MANWKEDVISSVEILFFLCDNSQDQLFIVIQKNLLLLFITKAFIAPIISENKAII